MINANIIIDNPKWKKNNIKIKYYLKKKLYTLSKIDTYKKKNKRSPSCLQIITL